MLNTKDIKRIKELYEYYESSAAPMHLAMIYINFGMEGALYINRYSVVATMIKKRPHRINSSLLNNEQKKIIYNLLLNDFRDSSESIFDEDEDMLTVDMIVEICKSLEIKNDTDINFLFDIYEVYAEIEEYDDNTLLQNIIINNHIQISDILEKIFDRNIIKKAVSDICEMIIDGSSYGSIRNNITYVAVHVYIKLYIYYNQIKYEDRPSMALALTEDIEKALCDLLSILDTEHIIEILNYIDNIPRMSRVVEMGEDIENVSLDCFDIKAILEEKVLNHINNEMVSIYEDLMKQEMMDTLDELLYVNGIRRLAIYSFMKEEIASKYEVAHYYDLTDEDVLLNTINNKSKSVGSIMKNKIIEGVNERAY